MAIYLGTWKDDAGVAFDPASFSIQQIPGVTLSTFEVYGNPNPDSTGTYDVTGLHNGLPYYTRDDTAFVLFWYQVGGYWVIAADLTEPPVNYWFSNVATSYWFSAAGGFGGNPHPFPTPHPAFTVAGVIVPDATGNYVHAGTFNTVPYWRRDDGAYYLYYSFGFFLWLISPALTDWPLDGWFTATSAQSFYWAFGLYQGLAYPFYATNPQLTIHQATNPDCSGTYDFAGLHNLHPYWTRADTAFSLWATPFASTWYISVAPGDVAAGEWHEPLALDGDYTPTAPYTGSPKVEQFVSETTPAHGTCRDRISGRRGGSGSRPGEHHGSPAQDHCRQTFCNRMKCYADMPLMNGGTFWENAGQDREWLTRAGDMKKLHGQAFYPRTVIPPAYSGNPFPDAPDLAAAAPPVSDADVTWLTIPKVLICRIFFDAEYHGGPFSGWEIFQLAPWAVGSPWFYKHTRLVWDKSPLDVHASTWWAFPVPLHWEYTSTPALSFFFRLWYKNAMLNFGPIAAVDFP